VAIFARSSFPEIRLQFQTDLMKRLPLRLTRLFLDVITLESKSLAVLSSVLPSFNLTTLSLTDGALDFHDGPQYAAQDCQSLKSVHIERNNLNEFPIPLYQAALESNSSITTFSFGNKLGNRIEFAHRFYAFLLTKTALFSVQCFESLPNSHEFNELVKTSLARSSSVEFLEFYLCMIKYVREKSKISIHIAEALFENNIFAFFEASINGMKQKSEVVVVSSLRRYLDLTLAGSNVFKLIWSFMSSWLEIQVYGEAILRCLTKK
jgi:hypothetical protein